MVEHKHAKISAMKNLLSYLGNEQSQKLKSRSPKFKISEKPDATELATAPHDEEDEDAKKRLRELYENLKD